MDPTIKPKPTYTCVRQLGAGAYATVWLAIDETSREQAAIKVVSDSRYFAPAVYEYNLTKHLSHPNICRTLACFKTQAQSVMLVQTYAMQGDLFSRIVPEIGMGSDQIRKYFTHVLDGVAYLHENGIVHRDIKPENIVVDENDVAKLCDFGMADYELHKVSHGSGTAPFMSPEILAFKGAFTAQRCHDIWALGVSLFVMMTGDFPWMKASPADVEFRSFLSSNYSHPRWKKVHPRVISLLSRMWAPPSARCNIHEVRAAFEAVKSFIGMPAPAFAYSTADS